MADKLAAAEAAVAAVDARLNDPAVTGDPDALEKACSDLAEAQAGVYPAQRVEPIPAALRNKYMTRESTGAGAMFHMAPVLKKMIVFTRMNLSQPPFVMKGPMDVILCRNVMIYFDQPVRDALLKEFHRLLRPDGYLMVGHSESLTRSGDIFRREGSSIYRPVNSSR